MARIDFNNLQTFVVVARERSFTRAARQLGVSQSALSHSVRTLEERLGIRLLTRTTRGVAPTEAGEHLLSSIGPFYDGIEFELSVLSEFREKPSGTVRITAHDHAVDTIIWPRLNALLHQYPDIKVELNINYGLVDIVTERFDAGVRSSEQVAKDMVAVRISPDQRMAVIGAPAYFANRSMPASPQALAEFDCINLRLPTYGGLYAWEFEQDGKMVEIHVEGQWIFNTTPQMLRAALAGYGLAYVPEDIARPYLASGELVAVLEHYWPTFTGYHLFYPSRRHTSPAFALVVEALRHRG